MRLAQLAPVGLDELVERAGLLERIDRKYVIAQAALPSLIAATPAGTRALEIAGRRSHGYRSIYLDTEDLTSYHLAGQRRRRRWKVRGRTYLDSGGSWLEVKTRTAREITAKVRIAYPDLTSSNVTASGLRFVNQTLVAAGIDKVPGDDLHPVLETSYERSTLLLPGDNPSRVTIDTQLRWTSLVRTPGHDSADLDRPGLAIVETKGGARPSEMDRFLWSQGQRPVSISKYGVGVAALHDVRRLKWHRVLDRDLRISKAFTGCPQQTPAGCLPWN